MEDRGELEPGRASGGASSEELEHHAAHRHEEVEEASFVVLESGRMRFFVRPRVDLAAAERPSDVQRLAFTLAPRNGALVRRIAVAKERMPGDGVRDRQWAWVDRIGSATEVTADLGPETYATRTRGVRRQYGAAEVAAGTYAIASHRDHVHLLYALEIDREAGRATLLDQLCIVKRASYIAAVFNPASASVAPARSRWRSRSRPRFDADADGSRCAPDDEPPFSEPSILEDDLLDRFGDRRFAPLEPAFLDHEGAELLLIGGGQQRSSSSCSSVIAGADRASARVEGRPRRGAT